MIFFIAAISITLIVVLLRATVLFPTSVYELGPIGSGVLAAIITLFIAIMLNSILSSSGPEQTYRVPLIALQDNQGIHGSFFLGSGTVDSVFKYTYYWNIGNGGAKLASIDAGDVTVYQDNSNDPALTFKVNRPSKWWSVFDVGAGDVVSSDHGHDLEFHIPPNSIVNNYTLDAK